MVAQPARFSKLNCNPRNVISGNPTNAFRPLRCVGTQVIPSSWTVTFVQRSMNWTSYDPSEMITLHIANNPPSVRETVNAIRHSHPQCLTSARQTLPIGPVLKASTLNPTCKWHMTLMSLKDIGTKVQNVLRVFHIIQIPITFPQTGRLAALRFPEQSERCDSWVLVPKASRKRFRASTRCRP